MLGNPYSGQETPARSPSCPSCSCLTQAAPRGLSAKWSFPALFDSVMNPRTAKSLSVSEVSVLERPDWRLTSSSTVTPRLPSARSLHIVWRIRISVFEKLAVMVADMVGQPRMGSYGFNAKLWCTMMRTLIYLAMARMASGKGYGFGRRYCDLSGRAYTLAAVEGSQRTR